MSAESIVKGSLSNVPKAVAAGIVDMSTGMLLAVKTVESHPQEVLDLVASATKDLFEGDNVMIVEQLFKRSRGVESTERYFQEILISSTNLWHYFGRLGSNDKVVLTVVCRADVNLGLMLMKCREIRASETV